MYKIRILSKFKGVLSINGQDYYTGDVFEVDQKTFNSKFIQDYINNGSLNQITSLPVTQKLTIPKIKSIINKEYLREYES